MRFKEKKGNNAKVKMMAQQEQEATFLVMGKMKWEANDASDLKKVT